MRDQVVLGAEPTVIADLFRVSRGQARVRLSDETMRLLERARAVVERSLAAGQAVYGLNTGLGAAVDTPLSPEDIAAFQRRAVMARAVGMGEPLPVPEVRAMLFARLAGLSAGASGISPPLASAIAALLNAGVHPIMRPIGTLGQADLSPLAQAFLPFVGEGEAEFEGERLPGPEALRRAGIVAPPLGSKDAIALLNGNALSAGLGALGVHEAQLALGGLTVSAALSLEAFRANLSPIDPRVTALRSALGQEAGAERLRALLSGSDLFQPGQARRVQDPLSFRCISPVHGAAYDYLARAEAAVETELNGAGDSPAVLVEAGEVLSTVNFDTTALALSFEALGLALAHAATLATFRVTKLMSAGLTDLPRFLTVHGGSRNGFATAQKTAAGLESEIRRLSVPLGPMTVPVADGIEDYAPMTPSVVGKTREIARHLARLAAVELAVAAQAVDLRGPIRLGGGTSLARAFVRARVAFLDDDRPTGPDFEVLAHAIADGSLADAVR